MSAGLWILVAAVVVALAFGGYRARTDGRFRGTRRLPVAAPEPLAAESVNDGAWAAVTASLPGARLGERATLVQFSSAFCAPCRATRRILGDVSASSAGVVHVEIDAEQHLDVVRRVGVHRTPTTLVLGPGGEELGRAVGAPTRDQVLRSLPVVD